jgi:hypothetical protein
VKGIALPGTLSCSRSGKTDQSKGGELPNRSSVSRQGSAASAMADLASSSLSLSRNVKARTIPPFESIKGEPVRQLAAFPLIGPAASAAAS